MYLIEHRFGEAADAFTVAVDLVPLDHLKLHEETIEAASDKLQSDLETSGVLDHPVVVERGTGVVLDGMHRTEALRAIGLEFIPVQLVDVAGAEELYRRSIVTEPILQSWYWGIGDCGKELRHEDLSQAGLTVAERLKLDGIIGHGEGDGTDMDSLTAALNHYPSTAGFVERGSDELVVLRNGRSDVSLGQQLRELSGWLDDRGFPIDYRTRQFGLRSMPGEGLQALIIPPHVTMDEVRKAAEGPPLPPKSTCFVLPARVLNICLPLSLLRKAKPDSLDRFLADKDLYRLNGPATLDRHYCEPCLYLFGPPPAAVPCELIERRPSGKIAGGLKLL